jgi:hypothetical protein
MADNISANIGDLSKDWDWEDKHVMQSFTAPDQVTPQDISVHDIIESGTVLIAAGPGSLGAASEGANGYTVVPVGLIETAQVSLNKPLSRIFEIGSKLSYIIPGRTVGGISLSRVFFDGPSIMKAMYFGEVKADYATQMHKYAAMRSDKKLDANGKEIWRTFANIGSGDMAMNLASTFFDSPMGLCFFFKNQNSDMVSQTYFEGCRISTYNLGISAGMNVLTEAVNIEFVRVRPILTADSTADGISDKNIVSSKTENANSNIPA